MYAVARRPPRHRTKPPPQQQPAGRDPHAAAKRLRE
jgi:hypothetical protein